MASVLLTSLFKCNDNSWSTVLWSSMHCVPFEKHSGVQCVQCAVEQCGHCAAQQCARRCPRPGNGQVSSKSVRTALVCNGVNQSNAVNNGHD